MIRIVATRLAGFVLTVFGSSVVLFVTIAVLPGSAARSALGLDATPQAIARFEAERGLDRPLVEQYLGWLGGVLRGDFGTSFQSGLAVGPDILARLPVTIELALLAFLVANLVAVPLGIAAGARPRGAADWTARIFAGVFAALPAFLLATMLVMLFATSLGWLPPSGYVPLADDPFENLRLMAMPVVALGLGTAAVLTRILRASTRDVMGREYVWVARARGGPPGVAVRRHVVRNALVPYTHAAAMEFSFLFGSVVVIEDIFRLPGLGQMVLAGILNRDTPVLLGATLTLTVAVLAANLLADIAGALLDPRTVRRGAR